jgi:hypothetical protein
MLKFRHIKKFAISYREINRSVCGEHGVWGWDYVVGSGKQVMQTVYKYSWEVVYGY